MKTNHVNNAGPARWKQLAHGRFRPARPERKEERGGLAGLRPTAALPGRPGWLAKAEDSPVRARGRDGAARPAAGGHYRPSQGKRASAGGSRGNGECGQAAKHG